MNKKILRALTFISLSLLYIVFMVCAFYGGLCFFLQKIDPVSSVPVGAGSDGVVQVYEGGK